MDFSSLLGFLLAVGFTIYGIFASGNMLNFWDLPSVYIVLGGTIGTIILSNSKEDLKNVFKTLKIAFSKKDMDPVRVINQILELSYIARKEGLLALEPKVDEIDDPFLRKGILLAIDGVDSEVIREVLEQEISSMEERHKFGRRIYDVGSVMSPAFGMLGTLIGLINMLKNMEDTSQIGPQMSVALVTTFYGSLLSNLIFIPISNKLNAKTSEEVLIKEIMIDGIISIQSGENTRFLEQRLYSYVNSSLSSQKGVDER